MSEHVETQGDEASPPAPPAPPPQSLPWVTIVLAIGNLAVFGYELAAGADPMAPTATWMVEHGGNFGAVTLAGEPWRLFTSMFLHYGVLHLAMNMYGLIDGGRHVERMYGRTGFAALYVVAGLAGSLATSLRSNVVSAGASGAIFGVFGAFGAFLLLHRERLDKEQVTKQSRGLLVFLAYNIYFGITAEGIDLVAHVGGLAAGFVAGIALELGTGTDHSTRRRSLGVALVGCGLVFGATLIARPPSNAMGELSKVEGVLLERWNASVIELKAGKVSDDALREVIEKELLPPWRAAHVAYERDAEGKLRPLMLQYLEARQAGWEVIAEGLRSQDQETVRRGMARFSEADALLPQIEAASK